MYMEPIQVSPERTPNPDSMKFVVNRVLLDEPVNFLNSNDAIRSPLASKLFGFPWTAGVFIGSDFLTITKQDWVDWETLAEPLAGLLREHFESGEPVLLRESLSTVDDSDTTPEIRQIKDLINTEIRPAVAMDGGDIVFQSYESGKVYIHMMGACAGCPSSTMTLKQGIETRMKEALPFVQEVIAV
jgi:Fe-S cluster biogenesis protein NfuA